MLSNAGIYYNIVQTQVDKMRAKLATLIDCAVPSLKPRQPPTCAGTIVPLPALNCPNNTSKNFSAFLPQHFAKSSGRGAIELQNLFALTINYY